MYSRRIIPLLVLIFVVAGIAVTAIFFGRAERERYESMRRVQLRPSDIKMSFARSYLHGEVAQETLELENRNGSSTDLYRVVGRNGLVVRVQSKPRQTHDVTFLFEAAVQDGIWELQNRPMRPDDEIRYAVSVYQLVNGEHGSHEFSFSHPHYWATTGGHQYKIHLDKHKPTPDLLHVTSTTLVEPRYEKLVNIFQAYGTPEFRAKMAEARKRVSAHKG